MNHTYRLVWNSTTRRQVPAAESARARGQAGAGQPLRCLAAAVLASCAAGSHALPNNGQVTAGQGQVSSNGGTMTITQQSNSLSLNWQGFSIAGGETVRFVQPSSSAIALNRVIGSDPSQIFGNLQANGQVFLLNPNGVLFGAGARVDVGGLVASTLNLSDADFAARRYKFSSASAAPAAVVNQGSLNAAPGGYIALLGGSVNNQGTISAQLGTVALGAGSAITLDFAGNKLLNLTVDQAALGALAENRQLIAADGGLVLMTAAARDALLATVVNNSGVIEARGVDNQGGVIRLLGGMEGGTVQVGGRLDTTPAAGACGNPPTGGGAGFIETSGAHVAIAPGAVVSPGRGSTWLIDPTDITINAPAAAAIAGTLQGGGNVTQSTVSGGPDPGDITVASSITWTGTGTLTLNANRNIAINAAISGVNGGLTLNAGNAITAPAPVNVGTFTLQGGNWSQLGASLPGFSATDFRLSGGSFLRALGGDGSAGNAYLLGDAYGLQGMGSGAAMLGRNYALAGNIDATGTTSWNSGAGFKPVGDSTTMFTGSLDGQGRTINNLVINRTGSNFVGLFGDLGSSAAVRNVGLVGGSARGTNQVGALAGYNNGTIDNAYATGTVNGNEDIGGLVGVNNGSISRSHAGGAVTSSNYGGGLAGENHGSLDTVYATGAVRAFFTGGLVGMNDGSINIAYATGSVRGFAGVGGLVGINMAGSISNAYATGSVNASNMYGGGLVGYNQNGTISNTYASGTVTGGNFKAGLIGTNFGTVAISNSYWDTQSSGQAIGIAGTVATGAATAMTTAGAMNQSTYGGYDFGGTWTIYQGHTYALLRPFMTPLTVTVADAAKTYDGASFSGGNGFALPPGAIPALVLGTPVYGGTAQGARNAGTYSLSASGLYSTQQGYLISYANGALTINPKAITVAASAADKVYDGNNIAAVTLSSSGLVGLDSVTFTNASATFADKNAGTAKTVTVAGISAGGADGGNYSVNAGAATTASITPKAITVSVTAADKVYDGGTGAVVTLAGSGLVAGDTVNFSSTGAAFDTKNAGAGKTVTVTGISAGGADGGNYSVTVPGATTTASITARSITVNASAADKVYDGGTGASVTLASSGVIAGDTVNFASSSAAFADRNVGGNKTVSVSGISAGGADGANYSVNAGTTTTAAITPATLTYAASPASFSAGQTPAGLSGLLSGFAAGDTLSNSTAGTLLWSTPATAASPVGRYAINGGGLTANAGNYVFQQAAGNATALLLVPAPPPPAPAAPPAQQAVSQVLAGIYNTAALTPGLGLSTALISAGEDRVFSAAPPPCVDQAANPRDAQAERGRAAGAGPGCAEADAPLGKLLRLRDGGIRLPPGVLWGD